MAELKVIYALALEYTFICLYIYLYQEALYFKCFYVVIYVLSFLFEGLPLLVRWVWCWWAPSAFVLLGKTLSHLHFWRTVLPSLVFLVDSFLFHNFKHITPFLSDLKGFCWEICESYGDFIVCDELFLSFCFKKCLWLLIIWLWCVSV